ncbi:FUSC family protein [Paraburkholderia acidisoli]|uniref:FUSC family protein n=1 Tax=Paraburkholderia acidisoli TaxID=2571748 RepID=A0A7Z2JH34_9BURK|nr:FUSC family protein [Paraburkholderia acidisoli]QGZ65287.1 FUSC family protein [Paraburkholderia acidisoli]
MTLPDREAWVFSAKTYAAALLALYLALAAGLDRPGWAVTTVYVVSQPFAGATASKSLYRVAGTLLGAAAAVVMVPALVQTRELLCVALALWVAGCLYLSLQDRSPRSYVFMLAGYSVAFIAFPGVDRPDDIFYTAVARVEEITLAVICSALVHGLMFPRSVVDAVRLRVDAWLHNSKRWAAAVLRQAASPTTDAASAASLLAKHPVDLELLLANLAYDSSAWRSEAATLRALQWDLERLLPILAAIDDRLAYLRTRQVELPATLAGFIEELNGWLRKPEGGAPPARLHEILLRVRHDQLDQATADTGYRLLWLGLIERFRELLEALRACESNRERLRQHRVDRQPFAKRRAFRFRRHVDRRLAALSCATAVASILAGCAVWIGTGWADGASVPMIAAVACSFFATQDSPLPSMMKFGKFALVAVIVSLVYSSAILPAATSFEMAALFMAPAFVWLGLLIAKPSTNFVGMVISTNVSTLVGLNNRYVSDFAATLNGSLALLAGVLLTALVMSVMRARTAQWSAQRIAQSARLDLMRVLRNPRRATYSRKARAAFVRSMLDRYYLVASRRPGLDEAHAQRLDRSVLQALRIGANAIDLRRLSRALAPSLAAKTQRLLAAVEQAFAALDADSNRLPSSLRDQLDDLLAELSTLSQGRASALVLALFGMRLAMFPDDTP